MKRLFNILLIVGCLTAVAITIFVISVKPARTISPSVLAAGPTVQPVLPPLSTTPSISFQVDGIRRSIQLKTSQTDGPGYKVTEYVVKRGDSPWSISQKFNLKPETILWGNPQLNAAAGSLKAGDRLSILPVDGVLHVVQEGDTLEQLESLHGVPAPEILEYLGNDFDLAQQPQLIAGQQIIIPNGTSPIVWSEARLPDAASSGGGSSANVPNLGTGYFSWPVNAYTLTQEFWSGHPGIDLATDYRLPIFASDSGTVVFSGWDDTGYGYFIVIDHGNGYKTTYGHNEANLVSVGQTVVQGQQIGESGNTGNSTGNHLDFRILYNGVFLNPLGYLP